MTHLIPLSACPNADIENLLDAAFGVDRKSRTAYKLRRGMVAIDALSFGVTDADTLIGSIQCWPVQIKDAHGDIFPLVLVGPVAVDPSRQNQGIGQQLMHATLGAVTPSAPPMVMIGDPEYYGRFGFSDNGTSGWTLSGPFEPRRLLLRNPNGQKSPTYGLLGPMAGN
jgi:predicted N-acetyltransferase YhbS